MAVELLVKAGEHDRELCPVKVSIDADKLGNDFAGLKSCTIVGENGAKTAGQCEASGDGKVIIFWILDRLKAGAQKKFTVLPEANESSLVKLNHVEGQRIDLTIRGEHFTSYRYHKDQLKPYLMPVMGPFGHTVTRGETSPEGHKHDHIHHRSIWVSYGDVNGYDFWAEGDKSDRQLHKSFEKIVEGPVFSEIFANNEWISRDGTKKIIDESRDMKFYNLPRSQRIIDINVHFTASYGDASFNDTKEAGLVSVRVYPTMTVDRPGTGKIENAYGGISESETWGKMSPWCDYSGIVDDNKVGIAIFDWPKNFRYPTYWHVRNYGLMTANIFGRGTFENDPGKDGTWVLKSGERLSLSFRVYVHAGDATDGHVGEKYHDFINPPSVSVV